MEAFNYLAVLISIILGLGIAQLLTGFGRWIEYRKTFKPFVPAMLVLPAQKSGDIDLRENYFGHRLVLWSTGISSGRQRS